MTTASPANSPYRVLGIDPGSVVAGWGLVRKEGARILLEDSGVIRPPAKASFPHRLAHLHRELATVLERTQPDAVAIESVFPARHARAALQLGHARGVLVLAAAQHGLEPFEYPPATVKKAVTGSGSAAKEQVGKMVELLLDEQIPGPADRTDALAVAICHAQAGTFARKLRDLKTGKQDKKDGPAGRLRRRRG